MKDTIAIVGLPASGKTVLWSVLASKYRNVIHPVGDAAWDFVESEWSCLQNGKWQPATNPLARELMAWTIDFGGKQYDVINCDIAGEDFVKFIQEHHPDLLKKTDPLTKFTENFDKLLEEFHRTLESEKLAYAKTLECQFAKASTICLLLDLTDDINDGVNFRQKRFVSGFLQYLRKLSNRKCALAFVVTKYKQLGETPETLKDIVAEQYLPLAQNLGLSAECLVVDAVADTVMDPKTGIQLPKPDFESEGLDELLNWMQRSVSQKAKERKKYRRLTLTLLSVPLFIALYNVSPWLLVLFPLLLLAAYIASRRLLRRKRNNSTQSAP